MGHPRALGRLISHFLYHKIFLVSWDTLYVPLLLDFVILKVRQKCIFWPKLAQKMIFFAHFCTFCAHFCIILTECNVAPVVGHGRQVYDMISDIFFFKNCQKRPKMAKMTKNGHLVHISALFLHSERLPL